MELGYLAGAVVKIVAIIAYFYGLMRVMGNKSIWIKIGGVVLAFLVIQGAFDIKFGDSPILSDFDRGLLFQAGAMTMVALGLNLIYGFNGQFSLGQFGFYAIGAYTSADITFRWVNGDARGFLVAGLGVLLGGAAIWGVKLFLSHYRRVPVLSSFTFYMLATVVSWTIAVLLGNLLNPLFAGLVGNTAAPGFLATPWPLQNVIFPLSVIIAGVFAAEVSFLFGLPVLSLGSDYFGIATLGFTIVVSTLLVNTDTLLPFPEMRGGRGMIGIPKVTNWFWLFAFLMVVIIAMRNILQSSTGRTMLSVREDETAARAMGVDVANTKLLTFTIGSLFAGLAGGVYAHYIGFLSPDTFNFITGFNPLIIIVFGGLGSMSGTIAASFGWTFFLEGLLRNILGTLGTDAPTWRYVLYPITLLLVMLLRPQGLLGTVEWGFLKAKQFVIRKKTESTNSVSIP